MISEHSNRPFHCPHCPHRSKTKEKLDKHVACHQAANTFSCPHCHQKFAFKNSMNKHLKKGRCEVLKKLSGEGKPRKSHHRSARTKTTETTVRPDSFNDFKSNPKNKIYDGFSTINTDQISFWFEASSVLPDLAIYHHLGYFLNHLATNILLWWLGNLAAFGKLSKKPV